MLRRVGCANKHFVMVTAMCLKLLATHPRFNCFVPSCTQNFMGHTRSTPSPYSNHKSFYTSSSASKGDLPSAMASQHDIDLAGDLVLLIGSCEDQKLIRLHSKVLNLASPIFAAMLSTRFTEGQALANDDSSNTTAILLPDN